MAITVNGRRIVRRRGKPINDERFRLAANDESYRTAVNDESYRTAANDNSYRVAANDSKYSKSSTKASSSSNVDDVIKGTKSSSSAPVSKSASKSAAPKTIDNVLKASPNKGVINPPNYYGEGERLYRTAQTNIVKPKPNFITVGKPYGDNHGRLVGKPYSTNYPVPFRGTSVVPVDAAPNFTLEGEPYSSEPNFRTVGKPYGPTNLPAEYRGTNVVPYTGNASSAVAEPSLLSRVGNFIGNATKTGLRALPFIGSAYELFGNNNPANAVSVAGSSLSPLSLLFYSTDLADGTLTPEQLEEGRKYAEKVEQAKKEIAPFVGDLGHQLVGGKSIIRDLPVDPLAGIDRENKWTPNLTDSETKKVAAPVKRQVQQTVPASSSPAPVRRQAASPMETAIATPSPREQLMARRAAALQGARNESATAAAQQPNFDWHYYNYVKNNLGYRSDASALQFMGYNRDQLGQFLDPNGRLRTSYIPEGFMVGR